MHKVGIIYFTIILSPTQHSKYLNDELLIQDFEYEEWIY